MINKRKKKNWRKSKFIKTKPIGKNVNKHEKQKTISTTTSSYTVQQGLRSGSHCSFSPRKGSPSRLFISESLLVIEEEISPERTEDWVAFEPVRRGGHDGREAAAGLCLFPFSFFVFVLCLFVFWWGYFVYALVFFFFLIVFGLLFCCYFSLFPFSLCGFVVVVFGGRMLFCFFLSRCVWFIILFIFSLVYFLFRLAIFSCLLRV